MDEIVGGQKNDIGDFFAHLVSEEDEDSSDSGFEKKQLQLEEEKKFQNGKEGKEKIPVISFCENDDATTATAGAVEVVEEDIY